MDRVTQVSLWLGELVNHALEVASAVTDDAADRAAAGIEGVRAVAHRILEYVHGGRVDDAHADAVKQLVIEQTDADRTVTEKGE